MTILLKILTGFSVLFFLFNFGWLLARFVLPAIVAGLGRLSRNVGLRPLPPEAGKLFAGFGIGLLCLISAVWVIGFMYAIGEFLWLMWNHWEATTLEP